MASVKPHREAGKTVSVEICVRTLHASDRSAGSAGSTWDHSVRRRFSMKRFVTTITAVFVLAGAFVPVLGAAKQQARKAVPRKAAVVSAVCPVLHTKISDVSKAAGKSVYKGKTYYFCCADCKAAFDKNPEKYIKSAKSSGSNKSAPKKSAPKK
jgi:YHS domain-containing protein